ncbi:MAG: thioesterase family protein, partial [Pseudomonadota bacterium]
HELGLRESSGLDLVVKSEALKMKNFEVLPAWIDYNGHMTDFRYAQVFSETCDHMLGLLGMDDEYVNNGYGYYTTECKINYLDECKLGQRLYTTCQLVSGSPKHIHAYFELCCEETNEAIAVSEQLFLHVARDQGGVCAARQDIADNVMALVEAHKMLPAPSSVGRHVGQRDK